MLLLLFLLYREKMATKTAIFVILLREFIIKLYIFELILYILKKKSSNKYLSKYNDKTRFSKMKTE